MNVSSATHRLIRAAIEPLEPRRLLAVAGVDYAVPELSSNEDARYQLFLDFDGSEAIRGWEGYTPQMGLQMGQTIHNVPARAPFGGTAADIQAIWRGVADLYSPFDLNVTTVDPGLSNSDLTGSDVQRIVVGGFAPSFADGKGFGAGISVAGSLTNTGRVNDANTAFVFTEGGVAPATDLNDPLAIRSADGITRVGRNMLVYAAAHEAGHAFGLLHERAVDRVEAGTVPHSIMETPWLYEPDASEPEGQRLIFSNAGTIFEQGRFEFPVTPRSLDKPDRDPIEARIQQDTFGILSASVEGVELHQGGTVFGLFGDFSVREATTGPGLRDDDHADDGGLVGSVAGEATPLELVHVSGKARNSGVIGEPGDLDWFVLNFESERQQRVLLQVQSDSRNGPLLPTLEVFTSDGGDPGTSIGFIPPRTGATGLRGGTIGADLPAGEYLVRASGHNDTVGGYDLRAFYENPIAGDETPLYVIVHGAALTLGSDASAPAPLWPRSMAAAVNDRLQMGLSDSELDAAWIEHDAVTTTASASNPFLLFDWAPRSTQRVENAGSADEADVAGALADFVEQRLLASVPDGQSRPVHFIGHSRGAYVVNAAIKAFSSAALDRIGFLQQTTLDPQAYGFDGSMDVPAAVDIADNYYQTRDKLEGFDFATLDPRMSDVDLTPVLTKWPGRGTFGNSFKGEHSEVRDWYHWTIDTGLTPRSYADVTSLGDDADEVLATRELLFNVDQADLSVRPTFDLDLDGTADELLLGNKAGFFYSPAFAFAPQSDTSHLGLGGYAGTDLVLVIDTTTSMNDDIANVRKSASEIVDDLLDQDPEAKVGIVTFWDDFTAGVRITQTELAMTGDRSDIINGIRSLRTRSTDNRDAPEPVLTGLMHAYDMKEGLGSWRGTTDDGSYRKAVILFGDAAAKEGPDDPNGYTMASVALRAFNLNPVDTFAIFVDGDETARGDFETISNASRGELFSIAEAGEAGGAVAQAIASVVSTTRADLDTVTTVLSIRATEGEDQVSASRTDTGIRVTVNGRSQIFSDPYINEIFIEANGGDDVIEIGDGLPYARIYGGEGNDTIFGGQQRDAIYGQAGDDQLFAGKTVGSEGVLLDGGPGNDYLQGDAGNDTLVGGSGNDELDGREGIDAVDYTGRLDRIGGEGFNINLEVDPAAGDMLGIIGRTSSGDETDRLLNIENAIGSPGDDIITGSAGDNFLIGGGGSDQLFGLAGNDTLLGGGKNPKSLEEEPTLDRSDTLDGGLGSDLLIALAGLLADDSPDILFGDGHDLVLLDDDDDNTGLDTARSFQSVSEYVDSLTA
jgi:Ca2+-binding RTX toxin-like protein